MDARLESGGVSHRSLHPLVDAYQEVNGGLAPRRDLDLGEPLAQEAGGVAGGEVGGQVPGQGRVVAERIPLSVRVKKKIERVDYGHLGHDVDRDRQGAGRFGKDQAGQVVGEGILLPVDEVALGLDP